MGSLCRHYIEKAIQLSDEMVRLATDGSQECEQDQMLVFFGILLDYGSMIRLEAEKTLRESKL
jgi:hypothetical protein